MKDTNKTGQGDKKKFNIFDWYYKRQEKKGPVKDINALKEPTLVNFFKLLWRKLNKLLSANLIFIIGNFPIFFVLIGITGIFDNFSATPMYLAWGPLQGAIDIGADPTLSNLSGVYGVHGEMRTFGVGTFIFIGLGLLLLVTWGLVKVGTTYIYRNLMSGEAVFPLTDFFYIIKKNWKQSLLLGLIDGIITAMLVYNIYYLFTNFNANDLNAFMLFLTVAMFILMMFIRPYAYIMVFTFDLKLSKIIKNALYFTVLGIKRNFMALLGIIIVVALNYGLFLLFMPLGAILPFILTIAIIDFMGVYAAYPNIIKYMMDEEDAKAVINRTFVEKAEEDIIDDDITEGNSLPANE